MKSEADADAEADEILRQIRAAATDIRTVKDEQLIQLPSANLLQLGAEIKMDKLDSDADTALGFLIGQFPQDFNTHDDDAKKPEGPSPG